MEDLISLDWEDAESLGAACHAVRLGEQTLRPNGLIHGGAICTVLGAAACLAGGSEQEPARLGGLAVTLHRPLRGFVARTVTEPKAEGGAGALFAVRLEDAEGRTCARALTRVGAGPRGGVVDDVAPPADTDQAAIAEPWRAAIGLAIKLSEDETECRMEIAPRAGAPWWWEIAALATFTDGPGALLAGERAQGSEFVTTGLSFDFVGGPEDAVGRSARGGILSRSRRFVNFHTEFPRGAGLSTYYRIK